jgi:fatty-acyl-CoA synthase
MTPVSFLARAALVHPERIAVIHGDWQSHLWRVPARVNKLANALKAPAAFGRGDTVSAMLPNVPAMLELHYAVPMLGAVLNTINTRLDADTVAYILDHGGAKALFADREYSAVIGGARPGDSAPAGCRHRRPAVRGRGRTPWRQRLRGVHRRGARR